MIESLSPYAPLIIGVIALVMLVLLWKQVLKVFGIIIVPDDCIGTVTKKFVIFGKNKELPDGQIVALNGEAGYQAETLSPGLHLWLWPWQYEINLVRFVTIPQGKIGILQACDGKPLPKGNVVACDVECNMFQDASAFLKNGGERGPQMRVLPPGTYRINNLLFSVSIADTVEIPQGKIGVVEALGGDSLPVGRVIAKSVECDSYQDAKAFIAKGGERGPQARIIPPGSYRINPILFSVSLEDVVDIPENTVGIVTTKEGTPLPLGDIAGPSVEGHNMFQNPDTFIANGGYKGMQEQVLLAGRYFLNPHFVSVTIQKMTEVPIAHVGVVIAFVGREGKDVSGISFKHGNLVTKGEKGVWSQPLDPGKYPINPYTHKVVNVPTANVVLNWATSKSESHKLDANLSTITVRSSDGFTFNLDVSQIIHIPSTDAPKVVARFGDMSALVTQVLEPTIGNYFRNAAQNSDVIKFLSERTARQKEAREAIEAALSEYDVGAVDTLIGDIVPPGELMKTLTDRKLAEQEQITFDTQRTAQGARQSMEQAKALADTQARVVDSERKVTIAEFDANAAVKFAEGEAKSKTIQAEADASVLRLVGDAEGAKILAVGSAEAKVIEQKVQSMEAGNYAVVQVAEALAKGNVKIVPDIVAGGNGTAGGGLVDVLMANLVLKDKDARATE